MGYVPQYFSTLVEDELSCIVRKLSERPHGEYWRRHVSEECCRLLVDDDTPFHKVIPKLFTRIAINYHNGALTVTGDFAYRVRVLERFGNALTDVVIRDRPSQGVPVPVHVYFDIIWHCTNLQSLTLELDDISCRKVPLSEILCSRARTLQTLHIEGFSNILPFRLALDLPLHLKSITLFGCRVENYTQILQASAQTLESIWLVGIRDERHHVLNTLSRCPNLSSIHLSPIPDREYASFLIGLGVQVKDAPIDKLERNTQVRKLQACPNLEFNKPSLVPVVKHSMDSTESGSTVDDGTGSSSTYEELQEWAARCGNTASITHKSENRDADELGAIFASCRRSLMRFNLSMRNVTLTGELVWKMCLSAPNLTILNLKVYNFHTADKGGICRLLRTWKSLCHVSLTLTQRMKQQEALNHCISILEAFRNHQHLESIVLDLNTTRIHQEEWNKSLLNAVQVFRTRRTRIQVCGALLGE